MKRAGREDRETVVNILSKSFMNDPHVNWLLEQSRCKNKLKIMMEYVFGESFNKGKIFLSDDNSAAVLWNFEKEEKVSLEYIIRNLSFLFRVGLKTTIRTLKADKLIYSLYPKDQKYCQLYLIGVLPEGQGKGLASALLNPMIEHMRQKAIPIHLETANPKNVEIYKKKGFHIFHSMRLGNNTLYWMRLLSNS